MKPLTKSQIKQARKQIGAIGGAARAESLTAARRKQIAKKAAQARWGKTKDEEK